MYKLGPNYKNTNEPICIIRLIDNTAIPLNPANTDYQDYLKWVEAGNTPEPADEE
jgi:hypothetical protein